MGHDVSLILTVSFIVFISTIISKITKVHIVSVEILLGSFSFSFGLIEENEIFKIVAELGFLYLMFMSGLEINLRDLVKIPKKILNLGLLYMALLYIFSLFIVYLFSLPAIFIVGFPLISIGLLPILKKEYVDEKWLNYAFTIGLIGEILSIVVLTVIGASVEFGVGYDLYRILFILSLILFLFFIFYKGFNFLLWWFPEFRTYLMPLDDTLDQDIRFSMMLFFVMVSIMLYLGLELALGAFVAGSFVSTFFSHKHMLHKKLNYLGFGWLIPIFFIHIGSTFDIKFLIVENLILTSILIVAVMITIRMLASLVFYKNYGLRDSLLLGLSHTMPLALLIAIASLAYENNYITIFYYLSFVLSAILQIPVSMGLIKLISNLLAKKDDTSPVQTSSLAI
ncbi:MAG: cation:proton antiporter [Epsilonproteobacteria bacterium]|nr:MAG: cation:proton antiporter [Campylobacterota bacterium]